MEAKDDFEFDATTLVGDVRDRILKELTVAHDKPWNLRPEAEQRAVVERVHELARGVVRETVMLISDNGFPSLQATLESVTAKKGFKAVLHVPKGVDGWEDLIRSEGKEVVLVIADPTAFFKTRGAVPITPDQPPLPYADEAAKVADAAEQGVVWWEPDDPGETFDDLAELMAKHGIEDFHPFEVCRTGWLAPRWAVSVPIGDEEGLIEDRDFQYFDTQAEATAYRDQMMAAESTPQQDPEQQDEPAAAAEVEQETPASGRRKRRPKEPAAPPPAEPSQDEGIVLDDQATFARGLEGYPPFHVVPIADGKAIWHCWRDAAGVVRGHEDHATATEIAERQAAAEEAKWETAEDRAGAIH